MRELIQPLLYVLEPRLADSSTKTNFKQCMKFVDKVEREAARRERVAARAAARENPHGESEIEIERDEEDPHVESEIEINSNSEKPIQVWPLFLSKKRKREQDHEIEPDDGNEQLHEQQHENEHEIEPDDGNEQLHEQHTTTWFGR
jgi:hypothetical protein